MQHNFKIASEKVDGLLQELLKYGFEYEEAMLYLYLLEKGPQTVWRLSKELQEPRSNVYRLIEKLQQRDFVTETASNFGQKYLAIGKERFAAELNSKSTELANLQRQSPALFSLLDELKNRQHSSYEIKHYQGLEGFKQVTWNCLAAKDDFRIFEVDLLSSVVDLKFAESMRQKFAQLPIQFLQLTNRTHFEDYTKVTGHIQQWQVRHLTPQQLRIQVEIMTYNNIVCMYEYQADDVFIIEITNQLLANMVKQMFDFYWQAARPLKIVSAYGAAELA